MIMLVGSGWKDDKRGFRGGCRVKNTTMNLPNVVVEYYSSQLKAFPPISQSLDRLMHIPPIKVVRFLSLSLI